MRRRILTGGSMTTYGLASRMAHSIWGVTATVNRADGKGLGQIYEKLIFEKQLIEMIALGYLADLRAVQVGVNVNFGAFHVRAGDFVDSETGAALLAANAPEQIAQAYGEHASDRKALVFTPTVAMAYATAEAFQEAGMAAEALDGTIAEEERRAILGRLQSGETQVVVNCMVLTEGFDEPSVDCIIVARPTKAQNLYIQMIRRGTRRYPGKQDCLILDVVGVIARHDLVTAANLFGVPKRALAEGTLTEAIEQQQRSRVADHVVVPGPLVAKEVQLFKTKSVSWLLQGQQAILPNGMGSSGWSSARAPSCGMWSITAGSRRCARSWPA
jgi:ATP-dependent helicase IRC3